MTGRLHDPAQPAHLVQIGAGAMAGMNLVHQIAHQQGADPAGGAEPAAFMDEEMGEIAHPVENVAVLGEHHERTAGGQIIEADPPVVLLGEMVCPAGPAIWMPWASRAPQSSSTRRTVTPKGYS
jgi:hypothetical protein